MEHPEFKLTKSLGPLILIVLVTFFCFSPAMQNGFTQWDDNKYITANPMIETLSVDSVVKLFTTFHFEKHHYHPLTMLSFMLEKHFYGLNPLVFILVNICLHCLNTVLVFRFIFLLTKRLPMAAITAILFGIHPMHVESVAWIVERKDVLYSFFYLSAMITYLYYCRFQNKRFLVGTMFMFICSLLSKPAAITLPVVLLLMDFYFQRPFKARVILEKSVFFVFSIIFGLIALNQADDASVKVYSVLDHFWFGSYAFVLFFFKAIFPVGLSAFYPFPEKVDGFYPTVFYLAPLLLMVFGFVVVRFTTRSRITFFAITFYIVTIFLGLGFIPINNALFAERYSYLAYTGLFLLVAQLYCYLSDHFEEYSGRIFTVFISACVIFFFVSYNRVQVWKDGVTLWTNVIDQYPKAEMAYHNRGSAYGERGVLELALNDYQTALSLNPHNPGVYNNIGYIQYQTGQYREAINQYSQAIGMYPDYAVAYFNRALAHGAMGNEVYAMNDFNKAISLDPQLKKRNLR